MHGVKSGQGMWIGYANMNHNRVGVFENGGAGFADGVEGPAQMASKKEREDMETSAKKAEPYFFLLDSILSGTTATGEWAVCE